MSHQYPKTATHCGTCPYWRGDRKVISSNYIEVKDTRAIGVCSKPGGSNNGKQKQAYESCPQWTKG